MIRGVTAKTVSVLSGIDMLIGNNLCPNLPAVDVAVVNNFESMPKLGQIRHDPV